MYNSKSAAAKPGCGAKEQLAKGETWRDYPALMQNLQWRKVLSAFYTSPKGGPLKMALPQELDPEQKVRQWVSVENYHHALKFARHHPDVARLFEADSGSVFATNPLLAKKAGGKKGRVTVDGKTVYQRPSQVKMDPEFTAKHKTWLLAAQRAKYTQWPEARAVLCGTKKAILTHWTRGKPVVTEHELMQVRAELLVTAAAERV